MEVLLLFHQKVLGLSKKKRFLQWLHSTCPEIFLDIFFSIESQFQNLFWTLIQRFPALVGELLAVISELLVALPKEFLEVKFFVSTINSILRSFSKQIRNFEVIAFGTCVRALMLIGNFREEKRFYVKQSLMNFFRKLRRKTSDFWQKNSRFHP